MCFICNLKTPSVDSESGDTPSSFWQARRAFLLAQCEGLSHKAIAEQMGISLRSVERYIADALYHCYQLRYEEEL